jgi:hypothetical protein
MITLSYIIQLFKYIIQLLKCINNNNQEDSWFSLTKIILTKQNLVNKLLLKAKYLQFKFLYSYDSLVIYLTYVLILKYIQLELIVIDKFDD